VYQVEAAILEPALDRQSSDPKLEQLAPCDDAVLPLREPRDRAIGRIAGCLATFDIAVMQKVANRRHATRPSHVPARRMWGDRRRGMPTLASPGNRYGGGLPDH
jgi:hypothetical protein